MSSIILVVLAIVALILGFIIPIMIQSIRPYRRWSIAVGTIVAVTLVASTSFYSVPAGQVGHLNRLYFGRPLEEGQLIALPGQNGPQAETLGPGVHFRPLLRLIYQIEEFPIISVPNGQYGLITAKAGVPLGPTSYLADAWEPAQTANMLKTSYFLSNGGQKGTQLTVLQPGQYRLNHYLFDVSLQPALDVEAGTVAVIKSNVQEKTSCGSPLTSSTGDGLSVPLVDRGCVGIWAEPLPPGRYYLNRVAYQPTIIPTQAQPLVYSGGYTRTEVELIVDEQGSIQEQITQNVLEMPADAADEALVVTVEGWQVPLEIRVVIQIDAHQAPRLLASVGDLSALENTLLTPALRTSLRDVIEQDNRTVLDLIDQRPVLEADVEAAMQQYGESIGVAIRSVRFGQPNIPAELLIVQQRQNLAEQLQESYLREQQAQEVRIEAEKTRAMADQQTDLVRAELAVQIADLEAQAAQKEGEGEKLRLREIGQVFSPEEMLQLTMLQEILAAAENNPDIFKVPTVYVEGESGGLSGPAAVLGASSLLDWVSTQEASE